MCGRDTSAATTGSRMAAHRGAGKFSSLWVLGQPPVHEFDLLVLCGGDVLSEFLQLWVLPVFQFDTRHGNCPLMGGNHSSNEATIRVSTQGRLHPVHHR